jgi:hypothetical protein
VVLRELVRADDPLNGRFSLRSIFEELVQFTKHQFGRYLVHASIKSAGRKVAAVIAGPTGQTLSSPYTRDERSAREINSRVGGAEDADETGVALARKV